MRKNGILRSPNSMHSLVVGAGWAGLAAAVELCHRGHQVTLLESARQTGGRARKVMFADQAVDNGQHLLIGAYHEILQLLTMMGCAENDYFLRQPLSLPMYDLSASCIRFSAAPLPAPLHLLAALLNARGLSWAERWRLLRFSASLPGMQLTNDMPLSNLLEKHQQTPRLIKLLWEPLTLAIMNTPVALASAEIFIKVMCDAFMHRRHDADLLFPRHDLGQVLPQPAIDYLQRQGSQVHYGCRVTSIITAANRVSEIRCADGTTLTADHVVLATPAAVTQKLLAAQEALTQTATQLSRFDYAPIATVYLQYPATTTLPATMIGMTNSLTQWVFDRAFCGQAGLMAAVISGHGEHENLTSEELGDQVSAELAQLFPHWPAAQQRFVIREKRATFLCRSGINIHRPSNATACANLWLAGDYTATGYPATLEGAVRSGRQCARLMDQATES